MTNVKYEVDWIIKSINAYKEHYPHAKILEISGTYEHLWITREIGGRTHTSIMSKGKLVAEQG